MLRREEGGGLCLRGMRNGRGVGGGEDSKNGEMGRDGVGGWLGGLLLTLFYFAVGCWDMR